MGNVDLNTIKKRKDILKKASKELKQHFVGIDDAIDKIISLMESWYVLPEIITRPVIICLWGTTGVGKTDLIRRLVRAINYYERYVEIQMDDSNIDRSLKSVLLSSDIQEEEPGILLLDEMQRFRVKTEDGKEKILSGKLNDVWTLLSDGKFIHDFGSKSEVQEHMFDELYWKDLEKVEDEDDNDTTKTTSDEKNKPVKKYKREYNISYWSAKRIKRMLRTNESVEAIMKWDTEKKRKEIDKYLSDPNSAREFNFNKLLIFICGNLDEAYLMSQDTADTDSNADILHEFSKNIDFLKIKQKLLNRFYPEQIARFGNLHVIYPTLNKKAYETIIKRYIEKIIKKIKDVVGISVNVDQTIYDSIYRNGVFPAQGVRPVLTTISGTFECMLPVFIQHAIVNNIKEITICSDADYLVSKIGNKLIKSEKINYEIDNIKEKRNEYQKYITCVHEAGHAVVYSVLTNVVPAELKGLKADGSGAYVLSHTFNDSKELILKRLQIYYAGMMAEEIIYGGDLRTTGCNYDISQATMFAAAYIRLYAYHDKYIGKMTYPETDEGTQFIADNYEDTSKIINEMLFDAKEKAKKILIDNIDFLKELSKSAIENETLTANDLLNIAKKYIKDIKTLDSGSIIIEDYLRPFKNFIQSNNGTHIKEIQSK